MVNASIYRLGSPWYENLKHVLWLIRFRVPGTDLAKSMWTLDKVTCKDPWGFRVVIGGSEQDLTLYFLALGESRTKESLRLWRIHKSNYIKLSKLNLDNLPPDFTGEAAFVESRKLFLQPPVEVDL